MYRLLAALFLFALFSFSAYAQTEISISKRNEKLLDRSIKSYSKKNFEKALGYIDEAMETEEIQILAMASLLEGNIHFALKDWENAKASYIKAIQTSKPSDNAAYVAQIGLARSMAKISKREQTEMNKKEKQISQDTISSKKENREESEPFAMIENVPIYPGCESGLTNAAHKQCMQQKITQHVRENFNTNIARAIGIKGKINISVQFKINDEGDVVDIFSTAINPLLEEESIRVMQRLPKMRPGKQKGKPVGVIYGLPIIFENK